MRKLRLNVETLEVESFAPREDAEGAKGTVQAQSFVTEVPGAGACSDPASQYCQETDYHWQTCGVSCWYACLPTGNDPSCAC